jgi:hypothetical protein
MAGRGGAAGARCSVDVGARGQVHRKDRRQAGFGVLRPAAQAIEFRQPAEAAQIVELLLRQVDISGDARSVAVLRSSLRPILKKIEDGHPITDVFIEKRATLIRAAHNTKEATVGVSNLRREPLKARDSGRGDRNCQSVAP